MAHIDRLTLYPVKGLDATDCECSRIRPGGTLAYDREFALRDEDGTVCNAKQIETVHTVETAFDSESGRLDVATADRPRETFDLTTEGGQSRAGEWFSDVFGLALMLDRDSRVGHVDRTSMGPSVISTATLETVASWFDDVTVGSARRRMRANIEVGGVPAFWEDRCYPSDDRDHVVGLRVGDATFEGVNPCQRCVVPSRDPDTGEPTPEFRERFIERREATFPDVADPEAFDHFFAVTLIAAIPEADRGKTIKVGDTVTISR